MCPRCGGNIGDGLLMCAACFAAGPSRATRIKTERERQREREKSRRYYARKRVDAAWRKRRVERRDRDVMREIDRRYRARKRAQKVNA